MAVWLTDLYQIKVLLRWTVILGQIKIKWDYAMTSSWAILLNDKSLPNYRARLHQNLFTVSVIFQNQEDAKPPPSSSRINAFLENVS